jgi:signal transduction histidine kinase
VSEPARRSIRDLGLPAAVGLAGILVSFAFWVLLVDERREHLTAVTTDRVAEGREVLELELAGQVRRLEGLAGLWAGFGLRRGPAWSEDAAQRLESTPGLVALAWLDDDGDDDRVVTREGAGAAAALLERVRGAGGASGLLGPERLATGRAGYRIQVPTGGEPGDRSAGTVVGVFDVERLLEHTLRAKAPGFAILVEWQGERLFARGEPSTDPWQTWWRAESDVALPRGGTWHLLYRPTPELAAARLTPIPHYLLAVGVLLSVAMAVAAHQLRVISRQSRGLAGANRALERRGDELEADVAARTAELEEVVQELEAFNHSVSHDLRSPLGAILNFVAVLEEDHRDRLGEEGLAYLARIRRAATRATALLEDLLQLSRAGRAPLRRERIDMTTLARESFAQVRAAEDDFDVEFLLDPLPEAWGDRTLVGDVFANLFSNALKYSRGVEKRRIAVSGRVEADAPVYVVTDNGRGFDMRFADKLFGLFERLHHDEAVEGTGIGLAMVARIVRRHGGWVRAEGRPGEGASFAFSIPGAGP